MEDKRNLHWMIFNTAEGKQVLADLEAKYPPTYVAGDAEITQEKMAQNNVVQHVKRMLNMAIKENNK